MAIFAVIALKQSDSHLLSQAVETVYSGKNFKVAQGHYLVNATGTAQDISSTIGISSGQRGHAIVYNVAGYFGYAPNTTWEWLKANMGTAPVG